MENIFLIVLYVLGIILLLNIIALFVLYVNKLVDETRQYKKVFCRDDADGDLENNENDRADPG
jgi:Na+/alanine symporter